jgi:hypothetical protein
MVDQKATGSACCNHLCDIAQGSGCVEHVNHRQDNRAYGFEVLSECCSIHAVNLAGQDSFT